MQVVHSCTGFIALLHAFFSYLRYSIFFLYSRAKKMPKWNRMRAGMVISGGMAIPLTETVAGICPGYKEMWGRGNLV